ncbi:methionine synthase reductase-like [Malaya genurostris]|uniref:methionine synthase reductase-like n=1 Tax=Malaya genurostris TaxID=325434 RepID=UPI0026F39ED6|nr:methionine synthase reductase-like [Malaya genurostris]
MINITKIIEDHHNEALDLPLVPKTYVKLSNCNKVDVDLDVHLQYTCQQPFESTKVSRYEISEHKTIAEGEDTKTVYDITLSTESYFDYQYTPGDTIGILTKNFDEDVDYVIENLSCEVNYEDFYKVEIDHTTTKRNAKLPPYIPHIVSIRKLLSECLDLRAIPKKLFIRALVECTSDETEKRFLSILCNKMGSTYDDVVLKAGISFVMLLKQLPSCKPSLEMLIEHLPRLMPRPYSIVHCHSDSKQNRSIRIIFSLDENNPGCTTSYLKSCCGTNESVYLYFRKSSCFTFSDDDAEKDIILIGVGTGIAPYLSFLEKRKEAINHSRNRDSKAWLVVGFRYERTSYLCREEIEQYLKSTVLTNLSVAFSRDHMSKHRYVQDQLEANKEQLAKILVNPLSKLYICGDGKKMIPQIKNKIIDILSDVLSISEEQSKTIVAELKANLRYIEDIWL